MGKYSFSKFLSSEITTRIRLSGVRCKPVFSQLLKVEVALSEVGVARPEGACPLGGSGCMLPQEILKF